MALIAWLVLAVVVCSATAQDNAPAEPCTCVPYYQCDQNGTIVQNGVGLIDIRIKDGECEHYLDVCCKEPKDVQPKAPVVVRQPGLCGRRNEEGVNMRITGDSNNEAQFGEFPWMAAVLRDDSTSDSETPKTNYICGGSLIHPSVVLTAAHCVASVRSDRLWVRLGEWDTQTNNEPLPLQDRRVVKVTLHPDFRDDVLYNDVALLTLEKPAELADHVDVVCVPPQDSGYDGSRCFASGWGKHVFGKEGNYQVILKKVQLPIVPRKECIEKLRDTRLGKFFVLHESFLCAGGAGEDTCQGDGGGPLVCPLIEDPTRYQQVGIVAWGIGCGGITPAVYANVAKFRNWIDQQFLYANLNVTYSA
ncbi:hypothetical protein R5R35_003852 [Gryllus longicercus]|uniref:Phenoloxidase-activating factor 2 n=1 Tax=Gryllus longicercus TaxID=2509291 RepID=A0AAN9V2G0_9ORTH